MNSERKLEGLENIRKSRSLTRADLSKLSGVPKDTIHSLEKGRTNVDNVKLSTLIKLSKALRVKVRCLVPVDVAKRL